MSITRQGNIDGQEFFSSVHWITTAATLTSGLFTAQRPYRIDAVEIFSDVTIPNSGANFYAWNLRVGGRSCATFTNNGTAVTTGLAAAFALVAESGQNRVAAKGDLVDIVQTLTGALTLNTRLVVHGRYVG